MKKSKLLILGVIALLLAGGLVLLGCEKDEMCDGKCYLDMSVDVWHGCSTLNESCAGDCTAWKDWTNNSYTIFSSCNCK